MSRTLLDELAVGGLALVLGTGRTAVEQGEGTLHVDLLPGGTVLPQRLELVRVKAELLDLGEHAFHPLARGHAHANERLGVAAVVHRMDANGPRDGLFRHLLRIAVPGEAPPQAHG